MSSIDGFAMELGDEDVQDRIKHGLRRAFQKIREADEDTSLAQADGVVDVGETIKTDFKFRQGSARVQVAIGLLKDLGEVGHCFNPERSEGALRRPHSVGESSLKFEP